MTTPMLLLLALGLAMDAFAVSITNGMCYKMHPLKNAAASGLAFGLFQGLMPLIGYLAGHAFRDVIETVDHWLALFLLCLIGGKMIVEAVREQGKAEAPPAKKGSYFQTLVVQAVATSIDALAVGVSLGVMQVNILFAAGVIALVTFACSFAGVLIGKTAGCVFKGKAEIFGGAILILIGIRIFAEHFGLF